MKGKQSRVDVYQAITDAVLDRLLRGDVPPWRRTWAGQDIPRNLLSGKAYRGINVFLLLLQGFTSPFWLTFKQAKEFKVPKGAPAPHVRKGEKGSKIIFWKMLQKTEGDKVTTWPLLRSYTVFNVEQCEGIPVPPQKGECSNNEDPIPACEAIVQGFPLPRPEICPGHPHYKPSFDSIGMPPMQSFSSAAEYYSTLFHELSHSTGHQDRLDRGIMDCPIFGSNEYSKEELVAEFSASFLCAHAGISPRVIENQTAYIKGWGNVLRADPKLLVQAAQRGQLSADFILANILREEGGEEGGDE